MVTFSDRAPQGWSYTSTGPQDAAGSWDPDALWSEDVVMVPSWCAMRPDEYQDALVRRGLYAACRRISTVDLQQAYRAGL